MGTTKISSLFIHTHVERPESKQPNFRKHDNNTENKLQHKNKSGSSMENVDMACIAAYRVENLFSSSNKSL
jgi:hypothetical protein